MVHGLATWGKCLSLKAVNNDIRVGWHAAGNVEVLVAAGTLHECCRTAAGTLQDCCRTAATLLQHCCRNAAGMLQACCRNAAGMLQDCCRTAAGMLQDCCMNAEGMKEPFEQRSSTENAGANASSIF